ncbi:hypothetical protein B0H19DRAFT_1160345 [Mycena capillaripes]|nr:hypothetical protein B0H19DRAFT_1160345 [Mycena capillaripes]
MYGYVLGAIKPSTSSMHALILLVISAWISKLAAKAVSSLAVYLAASCCCDSETRYEYSAWPMHSIDAADMILSIFHLHRWGPLCKTTI